MNCLSEAAQSPVQKFLLSLRYGDYPKLPDRSQQERDPWYDWDHPELRLNWGEPVREPYPVSPSFLFPMSSVAQMALFCPSNTKVFLPKEARSSNLRSDVPCVMCGMGCLGVIKALYCKSQSSVL